MINIFYIMGKSASGKDTIYSHLVKKYENILFPLITYTTRPMRNHEKNGKEYYFVSEEKYQEMDSNHEIIECRTYHTVNGDYKYFTARNFNKDNYLGIGDLSSYESLQKEKNLNVIPIYITVEDKERLLRSIERESNQKTPKYNEVCRRFLSDEKDFSEERLKKIGIQKRFVNDSLEKTINEIIEYINSKLEEQQNYRKESSISA